MFVFYASYSCLAMQLLEDMPCDTFFTNYAVKTLEKIKGQALVNKKKICTRITWNSGMITSENHEKTLNNFQNPIQTKMNVIFS